MLDELVAIDATLVPPEGEPLRVTKRTYIPESMAPDAVEVIEVCGAISEAVRVVPERHRHTRKRFRAHQFSRFTDHRIAILVPHFDRHAKSNALQLAAIDGQRRCAECKTGDQIGAAADAAETDIG